MLLCSHKYSDFVSFSLSGGVHLFHIPLNTFHDIIITPFHADEIRLLEVLIVPITNSSYGSAAC